MTDIKENAPKLTPVEQLKIVGQTISAWGTNIEKINNEGSKSDGNTKSNIIKAVEELQGVTLTKEQQDAVDKIKEMSFANGINTDDIHELAKLFNPSKDEEVNSIT